MTADDFVSAIDGLTFDENGRSWTLEVDDIDDSEPDSLAITISIPGGAGELFFDAPRDRDLDVAALQDHVVGIARDVVNGRQQSGIRTRL
ncbi:MAG TPA: hypothetical protein VF219_07780 [Vicinamibacterales bacterium]